MRNCKTTKSRFSFLYSQSGPYFSRICTGIFRRELRFAGRTSEKPWRRTRNYLISGNSWGSGLGTSSILASTVLGAINDFCGLAWDRNDICSYTLALEQLLTTGGGWQDQYGGVFPVSSCFSPKPVSNRIL